MISSQMRAGLLAGLVLVLTFGACGGSTTTTVPSNGDAGGSGDAAGGGDAGLGGDGGDSGPSAARCPESAQEAGKPCPRTGLTCEFGTDPRPSCRTLARCEANGWSITSPKCAQIPPATCPASRAAAQGQGCTPESAICIYENDLSCSCTTCPNPYPLCQTLPAPVWACQAPNSDAECPPARPHLGANCAKAGKTCAYGCERENNLLCVGDVWQLDPDQKFGCPASTRLVKRDIKYVTPTEEEALGAEIGNVRLATYEYVDPALAGKRRLGFILEDQPMSFAGDAEKNQVDLYAFTSTLVAAVKQQARDIDALKREVQALRAAASVKTESTKRALAARPASKPASAAASPQTTR